MLYKNYIYPKLMTASLKNRSIMALRRELIGKAYGEVLEIGIGEGTNLALYPDAIGRITAVDCFIRTMPQSRIKVELVDESVCSMSFADATFDTAVSTFCLCSVGDENNALSELYRVLKPGGQLLFLEHGRAFSRSAEKLQKLFNHVYNKLAFGCRLDCDHIKSIEEAGFVLAEHRAVRAAIHPRLLVGYAYFGRAIKPQNRRPM